MYKKQQENHNAIKGDKWMLHNYIKTSVVLSGRRAGPSPLPLHDPTQGSYSPITASSSTYIILPFIDTPEHIQTNIQQTIKINNK